MQGAENVAPNVRLLWELALGIVTIVQYSPACLAPITDLRILLRNSLENGSLDPVLTKHLILAAFVTTKLERWHRLVLVCVVARKSTAYLSENNGGSHEWKGNQA